ncbi:hypothetical protein [Mangrovicoccus sp. HB161399]|uniref:hypothetical protein n=1 Tax=Mangrovicoccus sp. HB161399 TaxID=2720392 RepID=UPI001C12F819|nr:hypothetical protein [Mangrovicoccus sp. HB161399]
MTGSSATLLPPDTAARAALTAEAYRLIDSLPPGAESEAALDQLAPLLGPRGEGAPSPETARAALHRRLSQYPLGGLLAFPPTAVAPNSASLHCLRAWLLASALDAAAKGEADHTAWRFAARIARQLCTDDDWQDLRLRLPDLTGLPLVDMRQRLAGWIKAEIQAETPHAGQLEHIRRALDQLAGAQRRQPTTAKRQRTDKSRSFVASAAGSFRRSAGAGARPRSTVILSWEGHDHEADPFHSVEEAVDAAAPGEIISETDDLGEVIEEMHEADPVASVLHSRHLTAPEAQQLAQDARRAVMAGAGHGVAMLAASQILNISIAELMALPREMPGTAGTAWLHDGPEGLGLGSAPEVTAAARLPRGAFVVLLPGPIASAVRAALASGLTAAELEEQARAWLARRPGRTQRLSRVTQCLPAALAADGVDAAVAGLLCNADIRTTPQLYYTRVSTSVLQETCRRFARDWLGTEHETLRVLPLSRSHPMIGSVLVPADKVVIDFFAGLSGNLDAAADRMARREIGAVPGYHAAFVAMQAGLLACTTAARPHLEACPPFAQMQLIGYNPVIRIRDKGNRQVDDARWLPVCDAQMEAFRQLRIHLGELRAWALPTSPDLVRHIDLALAGETSPLFALPPVGKLPEPLTWATFWKAHCPRGQARNMVRHWWRTAFVAKGMPGWQIDFFLGHGRWQGAQYLPLGAYRASDLAPLRAAIEARLRSLSITSPLARRLPQ